MIDIQISDLFEKNGTAASLGCVHCQVEVRRDHRDLEPALQRYIQARAVQLESSAISEVAPVAAARKAYRALGKDPGRYRVSSEALLRRIRQGKGLYRINTVVDTNNLVSLHLPRRAKRRRRHSCFFASPRSALLSNRMRGKPAEATWNI